MNRLLGQKVHCTSYLKKIKDGVHYWKKPDGKSWEYYAVDKEYAEKEAEFWKILRTYDEIQNFEKPRLAEIGEELEKEYYRNTPAEFDGYIIGEEKIAITKKLRCDCEDILVGDGDFEEHYYISKEPDKIVDCYKIAYRMNGKRYVPKESIAFYYSFLYGNEGNI